MLRLENISLYQFKNYKQQSFIFHERITGICGNNGLGKTNLLDAIYFLCFSKSYFSRTDASSVHHGLAGMRIEGYFSKDGAEEKIVCIIRENNRKELQRNGVDYKKFSDHIGHFPAVIIAPDDVELITGSSELRRKFIDTLLSQLDSDYLKLLIDYNRIILQRNSFLKSAAERAYVNHDLLDTLDRQLEKPGQAIFDKRRNFLEKFLPTVSKNYLQIAGSPDPVTVTYYSPLLENSLSALLATFKQKDILLQRTTTGIHKDDLEFTYHNESFKQVASQGQRKSLLFALKLAEFEQLKQAKGYPPLLLLDDVFEKLDVQRMQNLLQRVCFYNHGQVFITDTHKERLEEALMSLNVEYQVVELA